MEFNDRRRLMWEVSRVRCFLWTILILGVFVLPFAAGCGGGGGDDGKVEPEVTEDVGGGGDVTPEVGEDAIAEVGEDAAEEVAEEVTDEVADEVQEEVACEPDCEGKQCGSDGCDGNCGECGEGQTCEDGSCVGGGEGCDPACGDGEYCEDDQCFEGWVDPDTGLVWMNPAKDDMVKWPQAEAFCENVEFGGKSDWRFPTIDEMETILTDSENGGCYWKSGLEGDCGVYWTATHDEADQGQSWAVDFAAGTTGTYPKPQDHLARCVRGEMGGCEPDCEDKECGDDGCGDSCGECAVGLVCKDGKCYAEDIPDCTDKECGADGLGGSCGECDPGEDCIDYQCVGCQPDCGGMECGDDGCGGNCGACGCGEVCEANQCAFHGCDGKECGDDGCGGTCGACGCGETCDSGTCLDTACDDKECGQDGCGGHCGGCQPGFFCEENVCVEGACQPQCGQKQCGDDGCGGVCGECPDAKPYCINFKCKITCPPMCDGKECGFDDCGNSCGACAPGQECIDFQCEGCAPDCGGNECGDDGCGGNCGTCGCGETCEGGACSFHGCDGKTCGDDGCGGSCGACQQGYECQNGACIEEACVPQCGGKECGDDGCGSDCGSCGAGEECVGGQCQEAGACNPQCNTYEYCDNGQCEDGWLDPVTEYVWENPVAAPKQPWANAASYCEGLDLGGKTDWKMPTLEQLGTLYSAEKYNNCYWQEGLVGACSNYWSADVDPADEDNAYTYYFLQGSEISVDKGQQAYIRCVRNVPDCSPQCTGKECGDNGCGGSCGECGAGFSCVTGACECQGPDCGTPYEDPQTGYLWTNPNSEDTHKWSEALDYCYDLDWAGYTDWHLPTHGELQTLVTGNLNGACYWKDGLSGSCAAANWSSSEDNGNSALAAKVWFQTGSTDWVAKYTLGYVRCARGTGCDPSCAGAECGDDGCGGSCGACDFGFNCEGGACVEEGCDPQCTGKTCGDDGCGGNCGANGTCVNGACACTPDCDGKECGEDGCGDFCGACAGDEVCSSGLCLSPGECQPACGQYEYCDAGECKEGWQDPQTGYIWENPAPTGGFTWQEGLDHCSDLTDGGYSDWHLPTIGELLTLLMDAKDEDTNCYWPTGLKSLCVWGYWTSSLFDPDAVQVYAWRVAFNTGQYDHSNPVTNDQYIRCVRNTGCDPQCDGAECGDDGCGGHCGACESGQECQSGECVQVSCQNNCGQINANADCDCDFSCWQAGTCCDDICYYCGDLYAAECD